MNTSALRHALANIFTLYGKAHSFHWNVTGKNFQELHTFFEGIYTTLWSEVDELAEQIRVQGEMAPKNYSELISGSGISEEGSIPSAEKMITIIKSDFDVLIKSLQNAAGVAAEANEKELEGLLLEFSTLHKKTVWMIQSMES